MRGANCILSARPTKYILVLPSHKFKTFNNNFMNETLGFIGLGNLGTPIALNLMESGHALRIYNRTASKLALLIAKGATACDNIAALARECSIVFTMVSDDEALKSICGGEDG